MEGNFAALVDGAARDLGLNDYQLSAAIGLLPGNRVYSPKQVHRLRAGEVVHLTRPLVHRLIDVLDLPEEEAWHAAGLWPPDLDVDGYRRYRHQLAAVGAPSDLRDPKNGRFQEFPVRRRRADRRQRDRRGLRLVS